MATCKSRLCLVTAGGGRKRSVANLKLQASEQPHPYIMGWTWSPEWVVWPNGLSIKTLLYLLILLVTYMILGHLAQWAPGSRTCCPPLEPALDASSQGPSAHAPSSAQYLKQSFAVSFHDLFHSHTLYNQSNSSYSLNYSVATCKGSAVTFYASTSI